MPRFRVSTRFSREFTDGRHRFEHWYRDNTVYFITARCRDRFPAFQFEEVKRIFWDRANIDLERGLRRALELHAFLDDVPYPRYGQEARKST